MRPVVKILFTDRQMLAHQALMKDGIRRILYGGAKGGGKSWWLCAEVFNYCMGIIEKFDLKPSKNPIHIGWMGRKQAIDFTGTTLQTWRQVIPEEYYELKSGTERDSKHILIDKTIAVDYGGLDRQELINKFNSAEYGFIAIDQAEETTRDDLKEAKGSLRLTIKSKKLPYKELYTANPRICWLKQDFIDEKKEGNVFVPALPADNPYLPEDYEQTLQDAFGYRPELIQAYMHGDWSQIEGSSQVMLDLWLVKAMNFRSMIGGKVISCDPARFGDDKTIILVMNGTEILERIELGYTRTTEISSKLAELSKNRGNLPIVVDEIGIGAGVIDELYEYGRRVIPFNGSSKPVNEKKYYNLRAEAWWELAQNFAKREAGCMKMYPELRKQLVIPTYDFRNGKIIIESKDLIKRRLGRSPDDADCYVMGVWAAKRQGSEGLIFQNLYEPRKEKPRSILLRGFRPGRRKVI